MACLLLLCAIASICAAYSAEMVVKISKGGTSFILISGPMEINDDEKFEKIIANLDRAIVLLSSPGGSLTTGIIIGARIRAKKFDTLVAEETQCASACALAWLGGNQRYLTKTSQIGFHTSYEKIGSYKKISLSGNELVRSYLGALRIGDRAFSYITGPGPEEIQWLSVRDALRIGVAVNSLEETLIGATASQPATSFMSGGFETALRAAENFDATFRSEGIAGLSHAVKACYERAAQLRKLTSVQYCFTVDLLASDLSAWGKKRFNFPVMPYFTPSQVSNRAQQMLNSLGERGNRGALLTEWQDLAMLANLATGSAKPARQ